MSDLTVIDLFSGCGGFGLGMDLAGFRTIAAIDSDPVAVETYRDNFPNVPLVLERDLTKFRPTDLALMFENEAGLGSNTKVDVIVGGPPCQGFSHVRQVDGANHGKRLVEDPRRWLYRRYLDFVRHFQPDIFVLENVLGIKSAAGGEYFTRLQSEARELGYRVHGEEVRAWLYGVPQKRVRQLIIGTRRGLPIFSGRIFMPPTHTDPFAPSKDNQKTGGVRARSTRAIELPLVTLWEAIGDLPALAAGTGSYDGDYDLRRRQSHLARYGGCFLKQVIRVHKSNKLMGHVARKHSERDLRDFARLREGEHSATAIARGERMEFPYDRECFKDRYTRQHRHSLCSTIVAHLSKDGLMFIHPTQNRSLTTREAARVQSFPDWFQFPVSRTHSFRLIGNAVPPLLAQAVGKALRRFLRSVNRKQKKRITHPLPKDPAEAARRTLQLLSAAETISLREVSRADFIRGWVSVGFLHNQLHPDSVTENGTVIVRREATIPGVGRTGKKLLSPAYSLSGWPVRLVPLALEAHRRFREGGLSAGEYYRSDALRAGARWFENHGS